MLFKDLPSERKLHFLYLSLSSERRNAVQTAKIAISQHDYSIYFDALRRYTSFNDLINEYFDDDEKHEEFPSYTMKEYLDDCEAMYNSTHSPVVFSDDSIVYEKDIPF